MRYGNPTLTSGRRYMFSATTTASSVHVVREKLSPFRCPARMFRNVRMRARARVGTIETPDKHKRHRQTDDERARRDWRHWRVARASAAASAASGATRPNTAETGRQLPMSPRAKSTRGHEFENLYLVFIICDAH